MMDMRAASLGRARLVAWVPLVVSVLASSTCLAGDPGRFFSLSLRMPKEQLLFCEPIVAVIRASNPHDGPLPYTASLSGFPDCRLSIDLLKQDGSQMIPSGHADILRASSKIELLEPGRSIETVYVSDADYPRLPPGGYRIRACLDETTSAHGAATGKAVSNEVSFTVKAWEAQETLEKDVRGGGAKRPSTGGLIRTTEGEVLAGWRSWEDNEWLDVMPLGRNLPLDQLLWTTDGHTCIMALPNEIGTRTRIVVAHRGAAAVESLPLRGGLGAVDRFVPFAFHLGRVPPLKGGKQGEEDASRAEHRGQAWLRVCVAAVCGAAFSGLAVWLLMRRRKRAS